jgi:nucleotide-binding universal stress UspA family protein
MNTIVLATDGSPSAAAATAAAIDLASTTRAALHVVTAWSIPASAFGYSPIPAVPELAAAERAAANHASQHAVELAREAGVETTGEARQGFAVEEICEAARERNASLVVVGAHGWGALKRLVFGSVSTGVLHHAPCPVLVVRGTTVDDAQGTTPRLRSHEPIAG